VKISINKSDKKCYFYKNRPSSDTRLGKLQSQTEHDDKITSTYIKSQAPSIQPMLIHITDQSIIKELLYSVTSGILNLSAWSDGQCPHSKITMHCPPHAGPHSFVNISTTNGEQL
jgi:hypothetical protein